MKKLASIILCLLSGAVHGEDGFSLGSDDYLSDLPVILTVTRLPQQRQNLPASVTVIDRQMIEASGAKEIPELFRLVAGFEIGHSNLIGPRATVTYHGMSDDFARRMQVLVDGRSIYTPATGGVDWYNLPLSIDDIERIEVTRGPNGVTYGANSYLGVINILTYHPNDIQGTLIKTVGGDDGYRRHLLRHAGKKGGLDFRISMEYEGDEGNADYRDGAIDSMRDDKSVQSLMVRTDYRSGINDYLTLQLGVNDGRVGDGMVGDITQPLHEISTLHYYAQLKWKRIISSDQDIELQFYQNYSKNEADYFIPNLSEIFGVTPTDIETYFGHPDDPVYIPHSHKMRRNDLEFVHRTKLAENMRLVWGAEARLDEVESVGLIGANNPVTNKLYRLFANSEWTPDDDWIVNAGLMLEKNDITDTRVTPRIAVNYSLNSHHSVRASYSVNYRTPAILEEYADYGARFYTDNQIIDQIWKSDGDLSPEKNTSREIAVVGSTEDNVLSYDVRLFHDHLEDLIAAPIDNNFAEPYSGLCSLIYPPFCKSTVLFNDGTADVSGLEVQAKLQVTNATMVSLGLSHTSTSGEILNRLNPTEYISLTQFVPVDTLSLLLAHKLPGNWQASIGHYQIANMSFYGGDQTGGINTTDVRLSKNLSLIGANGKLAITVQNINGSYYEFSELYPRTRSVYFSAELNF